jgi:DNA-binding XRE family transcriptional regulator
MVQNERTSGLVHYRKRMGLTQFQVARLLGWKNTKGLCQIESGSALPTLRTALKLGIIYRAPIEFVFGDLYQGLRDHIRAKEAASAPLGQRALPLTYSNAQHS